MKRALVITVVLAFVLIGFAPLSLAANQPSQGAHSTTRNDAGFGEGPHCHVLIDPKTPDDLTIRVFPSHQGHASSGAGHVFAADLNCDGVAG